MDYEKELRLLKKINKLFLISAVLIFVVIGIIFFFDLKYPNVLHTFFMLLFFLFLGLAILFLIAQLVLETHLAIKTRDRGRFIGILIIVLIIAYRLLK